MEYNENYKKSVSDSIANAIVLLEKTKTTAEGITTIPGDFERAEELSNVITSIGNISLNDIKLSIESSMKEYENAEITANNHSRSYERSGNSSN